MTTGIFSPFFSFLFLQKCDLRKIWELRTPEIVIKIRLSGTLLLRLDSRRKKLNVVCCSLL